MSASTEHLRFRRDFIRVSAVFRDDRRRGPDDGAFMRAFMRACELRVIAVMLFGIGENRCCSYVFRPTKVRQNIVKIRKNHRSLIAKGFYM